MATRVTTEHSLFFRAIRAWPRTKSISKFAEVHSSTQTGEHKNNWFVTIKNCAMLVKRSFWQTALSTAQVNDQSKSAEYYSLTILGDGKSGICAALMRVLKVQYEC